VGIGILFCGGSAIVMHSICGLAMSFVAFERGFWYCLDEVLKKKMWIRVRVLCLK